MEQKASKIVKTENHETKVNIERIPKKDYQLEKAVDREMDLLYAGVCLDD